MLSEKVNPSRAAKITRTRDTSLPSTILSATRLPSSQPTRTRARAKSFEQEMNDVKNSVLAHTRKSNLDGLVTTDIREKRPVDFTGDGTPAPKAALGEFTHLTLV
jgi:hypothetical protein